MSVSIAYNFPAVPYYTGSAKRHRCRLAKFQSAEGHHCPPALVMDRAVHNQIKTTVLSVWLFSKGTALSPLKKQEERELPTPGGSLLFQLQDFPSSPFLRFLPLLPHIAPDCPPVFFPGFLGQVKRGQMFNHSKTQLGPVSFPISAGKSTHAGYFPAFLWGPVSKGDQIFQTSFVVHPLKTHSFFRFVSLFGGRLPASRPPCNIPAHFFLCWL